MGLRKLLNPSTLLNYSIIAYALALPLSKAATGLFELLSLIFWLSQGGLYKKWKLLRSSRVIVALGMFVGWSAVSILWATDKLFAMDYVLKYYHFLMVPIIFTGLRKEYFVWVLMAFTFGVVFSAVFSIGMYVDWIAYNNDPSYGPSPFMDHTNYSLYLLMAIFVLLSFYRMFSKFEWLIILAIVILVSALFINTSRTGPFIFGFAVIYYMYRVFRFKPIPIVVSVVMVLATFLVAYQESENFRERLDYFNDDLAKMVSEKDFSGSFARRVALWVLGANVFAEHPVIGTGIGNETAGVSSISERYGFNVYRDLNEGQYIDFHNTYIQYAAQLGVVGIAVLLILFAEIFRLKIENTIVNDLKQVHLLIFVFASMVGLTFHIMSSMVMFSLFTGIFLWCSRKYQN